MQAVQSINIQLDKPRSIRLDLRALVKAERALATFWGIKSISLIKVFQSQEFGIAEVTHLLWAGLLHEDPTLSYDQALSLFAKTDLQMLSTAVTAAIQEQLGSPETVSGESQAGPQTPGTQMPGAGSASGPAAATTSA